MKKLTTLTIADAVVFFAAISIMSSIMGAYVTNVQSQAAFWMMVQLAGVILVLAAIFWVASKLIGWQSHDMWAIALFTTTLATLIQYTGRLGTAQMNPGDIVFWCLYGIMVTLLLVLLVGYDLLGLYPGTRRAGWLLVIAGVAAWGTGLLRFGDGISAWLFMFSSLGTIAIVIGVWKLLQARRSETPGGQSTSQGASTPR
jgi:hypothetical protein